MILHSYGFPGVLTFLTVPCRRDYAPDGIEVEAADSHSKA